MVELPYDIIIPDSRDESKTLETCSTSELKVYTDGSGYLGKAGASAVLVSMGKPPKSIRYHLGPLTQHTTYEAEATGLLLGLDLLSKQKRFKSATIFTDNQSVLKALQSSKSKSGQHILSASYRKALFLQRLVQQRWNHDFKLSLQWISGHDEVEGNELADGAAKQASETGSSPLEQLPTLLSGKPLPLSISALRQHHKKKLRMEWAATWKESPRFRKLQRIDKSAPSKKFTDAIKGLSKAQASIVTQLRIGHLPLNKHLHVLTKVDSPRCPTCNFRSETVIHFILDCPTYRKERFLMQQKLGRRGNSLEYLLNSKEGITELLNYVGRTGRLKDTFGDFSTPRKDM